MVPQELRIGPLIGFTQRTRRDVRHSPDTFSPTPLIDGQSMQKGENANTLAASFVSHSSWPQDVHPTVYAPFVCCRPQDVSVRCNFLEFLTAHGLSMLCLWQTARRVCPSIAIFLNFLRPTVTKGEERMATTKETADRGSLCCPQELLFSAIISWIFACIIHRQCHLHSMLRSGTSVSVLQSWKLPMC